MARVKSQKNEYTEDLIFVFRYVNATTKFDDGYYTDEEKTKINDAIISASKEICIDRSYVEFSANKHKKVILIEAGWSKLCKLVFDTDFGKKANKLESATLHMIYQEMVLCYLLLFLEDLDLDYNGVELGLKVESKYMIEILKDTTHAWKDYKGEWQTWNLQ